MIEVGTTTTDVQFDVWVRPHLEALRALAEQQVGLADCDDVVQNTILRAWKRWSKYDANKGEPRAWLVAILLDQARRHRVRRKDFLHVSSGKESEPSLFEPPASEDSKMAEVDVAIAKLPKRQRQVIVLYFLADLSAKSVANVLGLSDSTVRTHLEKALRNLADLLGDTSAT